MPTATRFKKTYLKYRLVQLHQRNGFTQATIFASTKGCIPRGTHPRQLFFFSHEPPLRPEDVGVWAPDILGTPDSVETLTNFGTAGDEVSVDLVSAVGYALEAQPRKRWPHAQPLTDDSCEIRQSLCLGPGDGLADTGARFADLSDEGHVGRWRGHEGKQGHAECVGGRV